MNILMRCVWGGGDPNFSCFQKPSKMKKKQRVPPLISKKTDPFFKECWAKTLKKDVFSGNRLS